jgi:hypothetical protein
MPWTTTTYALYNEALRAADEKLQNERDRRYGEVNIEREKALKIKETADLAALELARESQVYKDERNDAMREQNLSQTGAFATHSDLALVAEKMETSINSVAERMEAALSPLVTFMQTSQGEGKGVNQVWSYLIAAASIGLALVTAVAYIMKK